jgi:hypothetical protein
MYFTPVFDPKFEPPFFSKKMTHTDVIRNVLDNIDRLRLLKGFVFFTYIIMTFCICFCSKFTFACITNIFCPLVFEIIVSAENAKLIKNYPIFSGQNFWPENIGQILDNFLSTFAFSALKKISYKGEV